MLENLGLVAGSACVLTGAGCLYYGLHTLYPDQTMTVMTGAVLVTMGILVVAGVTKSKLEFRRKYRKFRIQ